MTALGTCIVLGSHPRWSQAVSKAFLCRPFQAPPTNMHNATHLPPTCNPWHSYHAFSKALWLWPFPKSLCFSVPICGCDVFQNHFAFLLPCVEIYVFSKTFWHWPFPKTNGLSCFQLWTVLCHQHSWALWSHLWLPWQFWPHPSASSWWKQNLCCSFQTTWLSGHQELFQASWEQSLQMLCRPCSAWT